MPVNPGIQHSEDVAHASGDKGIMLLAVRKDTAAALAGTDGDYIPLIVDANGCLHIAPLPAGSAIMGKVGIDQTTPGTTNKVVAAIDQATANANEVVVKTSALPSGAATSANQILSYLGSDVSTGTGAAEELTIPANTKRVVVWASVDGEGSFALNANATAATTASVNEFHSETRDMLLVTKLSVWPISGALGADFFG